MPRRKKSDDLSSCTRDSYTGDIEYRDAAGRLHREGGPAKINLDGTLSWWTHGVLHRRGRPASVDSNGTLEWFEHGSRHRIGSRPALVSTAEGGDVQCLNIVFFAGDERQSVSRPAQICEYVVDNGVYVEWNVCGEPVMTSPW